MIVFVSCSRKFADRRPPVAEITDNMSTVELEDGSSVAQVAGIVTAGLEQLNTGESALVNGFRVPGVHLLKEGDVLRLVRTDELTPADRRLVTPSPANLVIRDGRLAKSPIMTRDHRGVAVAEYLRDWQGRRGLPDGTPVCIIARADLLQLIDRSNLYSSTGA
jgi:hypothetical protein